MIPFQNLTKAESYKVWKLEKRLIHHVYSENIGKESALVYNLRDDGFKIEVDRETICDGDERSVKVMENEEAKHIIQTAKSIAVVILHNHPSSSNMSFADVTLFLNNPSILLLTVVKHNGNVEYIGRSKYSNRDNDKQNLTNLINDLMKKLGNDTDSLRKELEYPTNISVNLLQKWKKEAEDNPNYLLGENKAILCESLSEMNFQQNNELDNIPIDGIRKLFEELKENESYASYGDWEIVQEENSISTVWTAFYQGFPVVLCTLNNNHKEITRLLDIPDSSYTAICDAAHSVFPECRMNLTDKKKIHKRNQAQGR